MLNMVEGFLDAAGGPLQKTGKLMSAGVGDPIDSIKKGAETVLKGTFVDPVRNIFSSSKQAVAGTGIPKLVKDVANITFTDQTQDPAQEAADLLDGTAFKKKITKQGETEFWDLLYDEPCWINPITESIDLSSLGKLWCIWFMEDDLGKQAEKLMPGLINTELDTQTLLNLYLGMKQANMKKNWFKKDEQFEAVDEDKDTFNNAVDIYLGKVDRESEPIPSQGPFETGKEPPPHANTGNLEVLAKALGLSKTIVEQQAIKKTMPGAAALLTPDPSTLVANVTSEADGESVVKCDLYKWWFCFIMKFLLGPAGLIILKFMPYIVRFGLNFWNFFGRLFLGLVNFFPGKNEFTRRAYPYYNKYGVLITDFKPNLLDVVGSYFGLVIPWKFISYDHGQKWGNGQFGKFIVSLMFLSLGLITMGSITVVVLVIAFTYYCTKTLAVFTDNIDIKKTK